MSNKNIKNKKALGDIIRNLISYGLPVFVMQFILQPLIAKDLGSELNGLFLTLISVNYFMSTITSITISKTRLLQNEKYKKNNVIGDFNFLVFIFFIVNTIVIMGSQIFYTKEFNIVEISLSIFLMLLFTYHDYIMVEYNVNLEYNKILINNVILSVGYILGYLVFYYFRFWQIVFIVPYVFTSVYDFFNTTYIKEKIKITPLFSSTLKVYFGLLAASLLTSIISYSDRMLLLPLIGGDQVSVYHSASIIGKLLVLITVPLSNVLLSYLVRLNKQEIKLKKRYIGIFIIFIFMGYLGTLIIGPYMLKFLYPLWYEDSLKLLSITTAVGIITAVTDLINVYLLRYYKTIYQVIINAIYVLIYLPLSLVLLKYFGLSGFIYGILFSIVVKLILVLILIKFGKEKNIEKEVTITDE